MFNLIVSTGKSSPTDPTWMRAKIEMNAGNMSSHLGRFREAFPACVARIWFYATVDTLLVYLQEHVGRECFGASFTHELVSMLENVSFELKMWELYAAILTLA